MRVKNIVVTAILASIFLSGCSLKNPFGIGYEKSVSEDSKTFGVSSSPKVIHKYRDKIRKTQDDYLNSRIKDVLYFGIDKKGNMLVKKDRDADWEKYEISKWKRIIDEANKKNAKLEAELEKKTKENELKERAAKGLSDNSHLSDITVTKGNDLSIKYQEQGEMVSTRTKIGNIIRDIGKVQQVFVANYVDNSGNLVSSHELYIEVKEPSWIVGEATPRNVTNIGEIPTPISKEMLLRQNRTSEMEEKVIKSYNRGDPAAYTNSIKAQPVKSEQDLSDSRIIRDFLLKD